ncbi:class I SAM-dependent methyltransferase [Candidatus Roizmanbacteria bacterium]|nr:MAG: class I SAM-dependent methyltransferase [Candidatus Roizmanbacteria bacterium]
MKELRRLLLNGMKERSDHSGLVFPAMAERQFAINRKIASIVNPSPTHHLLDICSGAMGLYDSVECAYTGMDISHLSLEAHPSDYVVQADAASLPFGDDLFDHAACVMALHSSFSTAQTIGEVSRVLKRGGEFTLAENGISQWICNLILLGSDFGKVLSEKEYIMAESFFKERTIDPEEYVELTSQDLFGQSARRLFADVQIPESISKKQRHSLRYSMVRAMNEAFHRNVESHIGQNGLVPLRKSIIPVYGDKEIWSVADPIPLDPEIYTAEQYRKLNEEGLDGVPTPADLRTASILYLFVDTYRKT